MTTPTTPVPQSTPTPKNGASTQTQQPAQGTTTPSIEEREAAIKSREEAFSKKEKAYQNEMRKNAAEKTGLGAKLSEYEQLKKWKAEKEKEDQLATLNPPEFAKAKWGEKWHDILTTAHINGVPPAQLIAAEMQKIRDDFKKELESRDMRDKESNTKAEQAAIEEARAELTHRASSFYESSKAEYPVFAKLGDPQRISLMLAQRMELEFKKSGSVPTAKQAADLLEADMLSIVEDAVAHEKYKGRLQDKFKPATVTTSSGAQGASGVPRRTLSNNLTASTTGKAPPRSDEERFQRSMEAFNAARSKGT